MDELKKNDLTTPEETAEERVQKGEPVDSSEEAIAETAPDAAFAQKLPADVNPEDQGSAAEGPANAWAEREEGMNAETAPAPAPEKPAGGGFVDRVWKPFLWPIVTLVCICVVVSVALGFTNQVTLPIIEQNASLAAEQTRRELLPAADGFTDITPDPLPAGITSMYAATNEVGYVVEAYAQGYGGSVPVMVAFDPAGTIVGVKFLDNDETPGLGQKIVTSAGFSAQFLGRDGEVPTADVDKIASATISSNAATAAVNNAISLFRQVVLGEAELTEEEIRAGLLPDATVISEVDFAADGVLAVYAGDDGGIIIYTEAEGFYGQPLVAATAFDSAGTIVGVWFDASNETAGTGDVVAKDDDFLESFAGRTDAEVDSIAGATVSSEAAMQAVQRAISVFPAVQSGDASAVAPEPEPEPEPTEEEIRAGLLPGAGEIAEVDYSGEGIRAAYAGDDGSLLIYAAAEGFYGEPLIAAVAFDEQGAITAVWLDASNETRNTGDIIARDEDFLQSFVDAGGSEVDVVAGATVSSEAAMLAVQTALDAYSSVRGAV